MRYLLDTNICIYLIRKNPPEIERKCAELRKGEIGVSSVTWAELCCGIRKDGALIKKNLLEALTVMPFGIEEGEVYGTLTERFPNRRVSLDRMIAAHAIALGVPLVTNNVADFELYQPAGLKLENWAE